MKKNVFIKNESGFVLLETLLLLFLSSLMIILLLNFYSNLNYQFNQLNEKQKITKFAHFLLESYPNNFFIVPDKNWEIKIKEQQFNENCHWVFIEISSSKNIKTKMKQLNCS